MDRTPSWIGWDGGECISYNAALGSVKNITAQGRVQALRTVLKVIYGVLLNTRWFNVMDWAQASTICDQTPDTVACMACSFHLPLFARNQHLAPLGVYDALWLNPEAGAVCGMCLKVWLPEGVDSAECTSENYEK